MSRTADPESMREVLQSSLIAVRVRSTGVEDNEEASHALFG